MLCAACRLRSQDTIVTRESGKIAAQITEVNTAKIKYFLFPVKDSVLHVMSKTEILLLKFKNGYIETMPVVQEEHTPGFNEEVIPAWKTRRRERRTAFMERAFKEQNTIYYNAFEMVDASVGFAYKRDFLQHRMSVILPVSASISGPVFSEILTQTGTYDFVLTKKNYDIGINLNAHLYTKDVSPFVGLGYRLANYSGVYSGPDYSYFVHTEAPVTQFILLKKTLSLNLGLQFRGAGPISFLFMLQPGIADNDYTRNSPVKYYANKYPGSMQPSFNAMAMIGYKF